MSLSPDTRKTIPTLAAIATLVAVGGLILMLVIRPTGWWVPILTGGFAAATVGALTDWFAVTAVFRRIPIPLLDQRTDIIIRHRPALEASLLGLLRSKVISREAMRSYLQKEPLTKVFAESADRMDPGSLERTITSFLRAILTMLPPERISAWVSEVLLPRLAEVDIAWILRKSGDHVLDAERVERLGRFAAGEVAALLESRIVDEVVEASVDIIVQNYEKAAPGKIQQFFRDMISGPMARTIRSKIRPEIKKLAQQLREIERTGHTNEAMMVQFHSIKAKAVEALRSSLESPELAERIRAFVRERLEDRDTTSKELAHYLYQLRADLLRESNKTLKGLAGYLAKCFREADADHWLNRLALEHLPDLVSHPDISLKIEESLKGMTDDTLRKEGADRVAPDLAAIRITGTALGFLTGCAIHGVLALVRSLS